MRKSSFWAGYAIGLVTIILLAIVAVIVKRIAVPNGLSTSEEIKALIKLNELSSIVGTNYLEDVDTDELLEGAYAGFADEVGDKYTRYYTPDEYEDYLQQSSGTFAGIGVTVEWNKDTGRLAIVEVHPDGPADQAGFLAGDEVSTVDGESMEGLKMEQVIKKIKGKNGTEVVIGVIRGEEELTFTCVRAIIEEQTVAYALTEDNIGYIWINSFDEITYKQFTAAMDDLKEKGMKGLVIDLRDNPGGRLQTVVDIADYLLPEGIITYTLTKDGTRTEFSSDSGSSLDVPLVVLINENSASASEILAGAIRDYQAGTLVGEKTFGKGIVQTTYRLWDRSALKVTMARYYTPNGDFIHGVGISPDVEEALPSDLDLDQVRTTDKDTQYQKALEILRSNL